MSALWPLAGRDLGGARREVGRGLGLPRTVWAEPVGKARVKGRADGATGLELTGAGPSRTWQVRGLGPRSRGRGQRDVLARSVVWGVARGALTCARGRTGVRQQATPEAASPSTPRTRGGRSPGGSELGRRAGVAGRSWTPCRHETRPAERGPPLLPGGRPRRCSDGGSGSCRPARTVQLLWLALTFLRGVATGCEPGEWCPEGRDPSSVLCALRSLKLTEGLLSRFSRAERALVRPVLGFP